MKKTKKAFEALEVAHAGFQKAWNEEALEETPLADDLTNSFHFLEALRLLEASLKAIKTRLG